MEVCGRIKWKAWCGRQGWQSPFLNYKEDALENENKILGFLGYLGWLGSSSATLKQALFAIKDAHKKGGAGDPTTGMHRLWILDRQAVRRPRRLGVTPGMLVWIGRKMIEPLENERRSPAWADCVVGYQGHFQTQRFRVASKHHLPNRSG